MWTVLLVVACGSNPEPKATVEDDDTGSPSVVDSGKPQDSGDEPSDDSASPDDTGEEGPEPIVVDVTVDSEPVVCDDPEQRERLGPMRLLGSSGDWGRQNGSENLWSLFGGAGIAIADFDGDGWQDIFLPNADSDQLYMGRSDMRFDDESDLRLPPESDIGVGATPVDIDGDGDLDVFVAVHSAPNRVLLNDGSGVFSDAGSDWLQGQIRLSHGSSWADIDGDGDLDVYVANYGNWDDGWLSEVPSSPTVEYRDVLWLNEGVLGFVNADERLGSMNPAGAFTFASGFWDIDDDGDLDVLAANDFRFEYEWAEPVRFLENEGGHFFDADPSVGLDLEVEGMGLAVGDLNGDDVLDVVVQAWSTHMMLSDGSGGYFESAAARGITSGSKQDVGWGVSLADMNNDGRMDIPVAYGLLPPDEVSMGPMPEFIIGDMLNMNWVRQPDAFYLQDAEGSFSDVAEAWGLDHEGIARGLLTVDLNRDGFLDLISRDLWGPTRVYLSRCDESAWSSISLRQSGPNPFGVGSKITVRAGDVTQIRYIEAGSSSLSSGGPPLAHVGLGMADEIDRIDIQWPDGAVSSIDSVSTRSQLVIVRD